MTVAQTGVVDWMGLEKGTGDVRLTIIDDLDWTNEELHQVILQDKLNTYLAFIESGEVFLRLKEEVGRHVDPSTPVKVTILAKFDLTRRSREFVDHAIRAFGAAGFSLSHRIVGVPS